MPSYALLGATGAAGSSVLRCLITEGPQDLKLNILVRSKAKLFKAFSGLEEKIDVTIYESSSTDSAALQKCLSNVDVVLVCVGANESRPGISLLYDTAGAVIDSLKTLKLDQGSNYHTPTIIFLRAAPINPVFSAQMPAPVRFILGFCLYFAYADLRKAGELYAHAAKETPDLLNYIFVDPGALLDAGGTDKTGYELVVEERLHPMVSYADLGAAFCELAERRTDFEGKGVGVSGTGKVKMTWGRNIGNLLDGAKYRFLDAVGLA